MRTLLFLKYLQNIIILLRTFFYKTPVFYLRICKLGYTCSVVNQRRELSSQSWFYKLGTLYHKIRLVLSMVIPVLTNSELLHIRYILALATTTKLEVSSLTQIKLLTKYGMNGSYIHIQKRYRILGKTPKNFFK